MSDPVVIKKPDAHKRDYAYLTLPNNIKVVVGSDPACDKAGAALTVNAGMCYERKDLPGLAHFLEHMLFTGTEKYPKEGDYHEFIKQNGGTANANTMCYRTNYMFEVRPESLEPALDRFARFFSEATLTKDCTDREINAVDSEFQAGYTQPWWRFIGIMNMSANENHPWHVAVGNNKVLRDDPKEKGLDLYEEMRKYYNEFYSANGMTVCVIGRESVEELSALVREKFAAVVDRNLSLPLGDAVSSEPPFLPDEWNRLLLQNPVKDVKMLDFMWVIPFQAPHWRIKPRRYASHLLGHEGKGSLTALLKDKGLICSCTTCGGSWLEGAFSLFQVCFELTDAGLNAIQEIGTALFTYIALLQKTDVQRWIFDEMQRLSRIEFKFGDDSRPYYLASRIAGSLQTHPAEEVLSGDVVMYDFNSEAIADILSRLTLKGVRVAYQAKVLAEDCTDKDTSYDSPMKFKEIPQEWLDAWAAALAVDAASVTAAAAEKGLHLPEPNPFIPEDLAIKALPADPPTLPQRLPDTPGPVRYIFHRQDDVFRQPKVYLAFLIRTKCVIEDPHSFMCMALWVAAVEESLKEYVYDAEIAGVGSNLDCGGGSLRLFVSGYHDKLHVLLAVIAKKMREMRTVSESLFKLVADPMGDDLRNMVHHTQPISQCSYRFFELVLRNVSFPPEEQLKAFEAIEKTGCSALDGVNEKFLRSCLIESLMIGNVTEADSRMFARVLEEELGVTNESVLKELPESGEAKIPDGTTLWKWDSTDKDDPNHAVRLNIQLRKTIHNDVMSSLLCKIISSKFFDVLRTQQQLGYIVAMGPMACIGFIYIVAQVQTEFPPDYARSRIDVFLTEHFAWIQDGLTEEEFKTCYDGMLSDLRFKPKNLYDEQLLYFNEFTYRTYNFQKRQQLIDHLEEHGTMENLRKFVRETVLTAPRMWTQVQKVLDKEDKALPDDTVVPEDPADLRVWEGYEGIVPAFTSTAEWVSANLDIN